MKSAIISVAVLVLIGTQVWAAETSGLLPAGKPAGVQEAQRHHRFPLLLTAGIAVVVAAGIIVAVESGSSGSCGSACSTTTTG